MVFILSISLIYGVYEYSVISYKYMLIHLLRKWLHEQSFSTLFFCINWPSSTLQSDHFQLANFSEFLLEKISARYFFTDRVSMAKTNLSGVICMLLVLTLFLQDFAECSSRGASSLEVLHRQLFLEMKKMALKNRVPKLGSFGNNEMPEDWELRRVPAGPDPLHHNGQNPKKPRTP